MSDSRENTRADARFETVLYETRDRVATITLNRPDSLNTIVPPMPDDIAAAVALANGDPEVRVIVLRGAGRAFCAGFDFSDNMAAWDGARVHLSVSRTGRHALAWALLEVPGA